MISSSEECDVHDGTCQDLADEYDFETTLMTFKEALDYKYVLDVDGNSWSARTQRLLLGGSLVFKSSINPEWWSSRVQPWVHYIPIGIDYSDLLDAFTFVRTRLRSRTETSMALIHGYLIAPVPWRSGWHWGTR